MIVVYLLPLTNFIRSVKLVRVLTKVRAIVIMIEM